MISNRIFFLLLAVILSITYVPGEELNEEFIKADKLCRSGKCQSAYNELSKLFLQYPDNKNINYLMGLYALRAGDIDHALAAFERVLIIDPKDSKTHFQIAQIYYKYKQYLLAKNELAKVLKNDKNYINDKNFLKLRDDIYSKLYDFKISGSITMGATYSNNANNDIGNRSYFIPFFNIVSQGKPKISDKTLFSSIFLNYGNDFPKKIGWGLNNYLNIYGDINSKVKNNNTDYISFSFSPFYRQKLLRIDFPVSVDKSWIYSSSFNHSIKVAVDFSCPDLLNGKISTGLSFQKVYDDRKTFLDSKNVNYYVRYDKRVNFLSNMNISLSYNYSRYREVIHARTDVNANEDIYSIDLSKKLFKSIGLGLGYSYKSKEYMDLDTLFNNYRSDIKRVSYVNISYNAQNNITVSIYGSHVENRSNQPIYAYNKNIFRFSVSKYF